MASRFREVFRDLKASATNLKDVHFILHTPIAAIIISVLRYKEDFDYVFVFGHDEEKRERVLMLSEEQLLTCPLELRLKSGKKAPLGFGVDLGATLSDTVEPS
jgi:hypothetical protein